MARNVVVEAAFIGHDVRLVGDVLGHDLVDGGLVGILDVD